MFKDEKGSVIVEAAIVFPIVIIVVLILITLSIIVHDLYVSRLLIDVIDEESHKVLVSAEMSERLLGQNLIKNIELSEVEEGKNLKANNQLVAKEVMKIDIPLLGIKNYKYKKLLYNDDLLRKVMIVEMAGDIFDDLTISKVGKDKYKTLLKSVLSGLKND